MLKTKHLFQKRLLAAFLTIALVAVLPLAAEVPPVPGAGPVMTAGTDDVLTLWKFDSVIPTNGAYINLSPEVLFTAPPPEDMVLMPDTNGILSLYEVTGEVGATNWIPVHVLSGRLVDVKIMYQETLTNAPVYTGEHMLFIMETTNTSGFYTARLEIQG